MPTQKTLAKEGQVWKFWKGLSRGQKNQLIIGIIGATAVVIAAIFGSVIGPFFVELYHIAVPRAFATQTATPAPSPTLTQTFTLTPSPPASLTPSLVPSLTPTPTLSPSSKVCVEGPARYGFECSLSGWEMTNFKESLAVTNVTTTLVPDKNNLPTGVLALTVDFSGLAGLRNKAGEVQVNLITDPPNGYAGGVVDLSGKIVTAWVWASKGSTGSKTEMNGFQLFIKDKNNKNCYGEWGNIEREEKWFRIVWVEPSLVEKQADPKRCDPDFNSSQPKFLGLKIALGDNTTIVYPVGELHTIYLNDVDWDEP